MHFAGTTITTKPEQTTTTTTRTAAIVNAANPGCLGGGGVDGAISSAGGARLYEDRLKLPVLETRHEQYAIRCHVGSAVVTGPGDYDELKVPYVIHAVGPNYNAFDEEEYDAAHELLKSAYMTALSVASETRIQEVAFSLLSSGIFRGSCSLSQVLRMGVEAILTWGIEERPNDSSVSDIYLFAFTPLECKTLKRICDHAFGMEGEEETEIQNQPDEKQGPKDTATNTDANEKGAIDMSMDEKDALQDEDNQKAAETNAIGSATTDNSSNNGIHNDLPDERSETCNEEANQALTEAEGAIGSAISGPMVPEKSGTDSSTKPAAVDKEGENKAGLGDLNNE